MESWGRQLTTDRNAMAVDDEQAEMHHLSQNCPLPSAGLEALSSYCRLSTKINDGFHGFHRLHRFPGFPGFHSDYHLLSSPPMRTCSSNLLTTISSIAIFVFLMTFGALVALRANRPFTNHFAVKLLDTKESCPREKVEGWDAKESLKIMLLLLGGRTRCEDTRKHCW